jgi:hypothetical protein
VFTERKQMPDKATIREAAARNRKRFFTMFSELCWIDKRRCPGDLAKPGY